MPYDFNPELCKACPFGLCFEDRRNNPVHGRKTQFRVRQQAALACTFEDFVPGINDSVELSFDDYMSRFRENIEKAGKTLIGSQYQIASGAYAKVEGDVYELLLASVLWNVAATWNQYMETGVWSSKHQPQLSYPIQSSKNKIAILKLPRNYDATRLFSIEVRKNIDQLERLLETENMELGLSAPDIVGVRLPRPITPGWEIFAGWDVFDQPLVNLGGDSLTKFENAYSLLEQRLSTNDLLFAIAIKRTMRSDRLYQPLFEANILKYLLELLGENTFKFFAIAGSTEGANVAGHYRAVSLASLIKGGKLERAIDRLIEPKSPSDLTKSILYELTSLDWS